MRSNSETDRSRAFHRVASAVRHHFKRGGLFGKLALGLLLVATCGLAGAPALAGECNADIGNFMKKRQDIITHLNQLAKASPKGQLDPAVSCPILRNLAVIERDLAAYLNKNKEWCMVPDNAIQNISESSKRTQTVAGKACQVAEQIKKGQEALTSSAPKLPTGPL